MNIDNTVTLLEPPSAEEFIQLRQKIGWGEINSKIAADSLGHSLFDVIIRKDNKLVGMARVVGDGYMYFYIQDVIVDPAYQQQGLAAQLMQAIEAYLSTAAHSGATIGLLAAKGKESFYARYGYQIRPGESMGHGMCKFV